MRRPWFAGGIGGVHRGGERTMDVSADLTELGRTPVAVGTGGGSVVVALFIVFSPITTNIAPSYV